MKLKNITSLDTSNWRNAEQLIYDVMKLHDFEEIRLSLLQDSDMLKKCLQKDFFTHKDEKKQENVVIDLSLKENLSLRPEGTINLLSNFLNNYDSNKVFKYYYLGNMIRVIDNEIEETYRLGAEIYGDDTIVSDITVIDTSLKLLNSFGFKQTLVEINSFGCEKCTLNLPPAMKNKWQGQVNQKEKSSKLPANYYQDSLSNSNYCNVCQERLHQIRHFLSNLMIKYNYNPDLKRTYNYYNGMVFNLYVKQGDEDILVGGGGRYDHLTKFVTGKEIPSIGFDLNLDIIYDLIKKSNLFPDSGFEFKVFICSESEDLLLNEMQILQELHKKMIYTIQGKVTPDGRKALEIAKEANCSVLIYIDNDSLYNGKVEVFNIPKIHSYHISLDSIIEELEVIKKSAKQLLFL
ncbi:ATP phosphoribosyltransferase regulatory subunit [bacterium]|nr:ATP phosphoribosyltransferase regulatory subunit [bacterium]